MALKKDQRKKASDIFEKLGVTVLIASIGDMVVGKSVDSRIYWDILGLFLGVILLTISIFILGGVKNDK
ncbi:MAG: hypothetical protein ACE5IW_12995 [bacterium]